MILNLLKTKKINVSFCEKLNLPNVTLAAIASTNVEATVKSLLFSSKDINFSEIILISHEKPRILPATIKFREIKKVDSYERYNYHVTFTLQNYIQSSHVLLVQHDGFVINPTAWDAKFLDYDYIGAPFPLPRDDFSYRDDLGRIVRVGNGGFSLRSKRMLEAPERLELRWEHYHGYYHEDGFLCCKNRSLLEGCGIKYAPIDIAKLFSRESDLTENKGIETFGVHGIKKLKKYRATIDAYSLKIIQG
jgi:hypothetical protein